MPLGDRSRWCKVCGEILVYHYRTTSVEVYNPTTNRVEQHTRLNGKFYCLSCSRIHGFHPMSEEGE